MQKRLEWLENNGYIENGSIKTTKCTKFLLPLVGVSDISLQFINPGMFINSYIKGNEEMLIYVVLNKLDMPEESKHYVVLQNLNEHYIDYIDEEEEYVIIYKIPEHFRDDYNKIIDGKYSKTSVQYKEIIIRVYGTSRNMDDYKPSVYDALFPTDIKRKMYSNFLEIDYLIDEVSSKLDLNYEIYKSINKLN